MICEVYRDEAKVYRFLLVASNGQTIASSEEYKTKASCLNGTESVRKHAPDAVIGDQTDDK